MKSSNHHFFLLLSLLIATQMETSCAPPAYRGLEAAIKQQKSALSDLEEALDAQSFQRESVSVGLEKLGARLDRVTPASAQWLELEPGSMIKWYFDEEIQNVYIQADSFDSRTGTVQVSIIIQSRRGQYTMRPGEAIELTWTGPTAPRAVIITCHRILYREDGSVLGLFSVMDGPPQGL